MWSQWISAEKYFKLGFHWVSNLVVWCHEENHAFEQQAQVERLVTLSSACFYLEENREDREEVSVGVSVGVKAQEEQSHQDVRVEERWRTAAEGRVWKSVGSRLTWWCYGQTGYKKVSVTEMPQRQLSPLLECHRKQGGPHTNPWAYREMRGI